MTKLMNRLAFALLATFAFPIVAGAATVDEIANYKGADRQAVLEAGAKKEGRVVLYGVGTQIDPLLKLFSEEYPYIRLEMARLGDSTQIVRRVTEEYQVNRLQGDGVELASASLLALRKDGFLQPFTTPEAAAFDKEAIEQNRLWMSARESYAGIGYNSKVIGPDEAPKTWGDLLKPQYKGRMGVTSQSVVGTWIGGLVLTLGEGYVRDLAKQDVKLFNITTRAVANLNVSGELPISVRAMNSHMSKSKAQGASVEWVDPGAVVVNDTGVAVFTKAPHPHAMMLLVDFLLSKEGQAAYRGLGYDSARTDMENATTLKKKIYLEHRPTFFEDFEKWMALFDTLFRPKG